ncbi:partial DNA repair protein RadA, partial [Candidatus Brocadiaceae bacterium]
EHMVDTVLQFEGDTHHSYRIVRALKNRYGSTNEIGIFEMREDGLAEITNPSRLFLNERDREISGTAIVPVLEGTRALLVEVQALVSPTPFGYPQRVATGFDHKRLAMLLAVIEKRAGHRVSTHDVFLNVTGGVRLDEPAVDLAVCSAIVSGLLDKPLKPGLVIAGEVGLGGEIRSVSHIQKRVQEAEKLGFTHIVIPSGNGKQISTMPKIKLITPSTLFDLFSSIF